MNAAALFAAAIMPGVLCVLLLAYYSTTPSGPRKLQ